MFPKIAPKRQTTTKFFCLVTVRIRTLRKEEQRKVTIHRNGQKITQSNSCEESESFEFLFVCGHQENYKKVLPKVQN